MTGDAGATLPPRVTCVIPVWDAYASVLGEAIESAVRQELPVAIIVVDNASEVPIAASGCEVLRLESRVSTGAARNHGLSQVTSPYVVFLDADDVLLEGALGALFAVLERHPGAVACIGNIVDGPTGTLHRNPRRIARQLARFPSLLATAHCVWSLIPTQGCALLRTEAVREADGYGDADTGEDWTLGASLAWRGRLLFVDRACLLYRRAPGSRNVGGLTLATGRSNARRVRRRLRTDRATPATLRWLLPLLAAAQWFALFGVRPAAKLSRGLRTSRTQPTHEPRAEVPGQPSPPPRVGKRHS